MEREPATAWLETYRRAWEEADNHAVLAMFTEAATYRAHPLRPAHAGHDGIAAYWARATADQQDIQVRMGDPVVDGDRVAAEFWATMRAGDSPVTVAGCLFLSFAADGRCQSLRECWHETEKLLPPPPDWGRLDPPPDRDHLAPDAGDPGREHARHWAEGYERAWRAGDPAAAAALYAPDAHYRSEPFGDPHLGRGGVLAFGRRAYATEAAQDPRFGTPLASGASAAAEWWATMLEEDQPATLTGISILTFTPDGLVATERDYWFLEPGAHAPCEGWGR